MKLFSSLLIFILFFSNSLMGQESVNPKLEKDSLIPNQNIVELNARIESMHRWRGNASSDRPTITGTLKVNLDKNKKWQMGIWGASAISNETSGVHYKEIDYFITYQVTPKFSLGIWDQFPMKNQINPNIFDYNQYSTKHYIDLEMIYYFGDQFPLRLQSDIALYGNDFETDAFGKKTRLYSTYIEGLYRMITTPKMRFGPLVGIGISFQGNSMEYGNGKGNFNVVNVGFMAVRKVKVSNWQFPVTGVAFWNPSQKIARVQISANLF